LNLVSTFDFHKNHPDISLDEYVKANRIALGQQVQDKIKIYLDTKYWIYFRDVMLKRSDNLTVIKSYELLTSLCDSGIVICPISEDILYEITKQTDEHTLATSIKLIDKFSKGISLTSQKERIQSEVLYFLYKYGKQETQIYTPDFFAWTKISQTLSSALPYNTPFNQNDELVLQKAFFDQLWQTSLAQLFNIAGNDALQNIPKMPDLSDLLNKDTAKSRKHFSTFDEIFLDEVYWQVDLIKDSLTEAMHQMFMQNTGKSISIEEYKLNREDKLFRNMIINLFKLRKEKKNFPTIKVGAGIHAAVRLDSKRKFSPNDYYDFRHAQAAIPYCDFFFTEKNLRHLLKTNTLAYDKEYNCEVVSKPKDVFQALKYINSKAQGIDN